MGNGQPSPSSYHQNHHQQQHGHIHQQAQQQQHPGLSPNALMRQSSLGGHQQQPQQQNIFKSQYQQWSNPPPTMTPQNSGWQTSGANGAALAPNCQSQNAWARGRSVPNLNPIITTPRSNMLGKPSSPMLQQQQQQQQAGSSSTSSPFGSSSVLGVNMHGGSNSPMSPSKYRRSTSYPGKMPGGQGSPFALDHHHAGMSGVGGVEDIRDAYQSYQVSDNGCRISV